MMNRFLTWLHGGSEAAPAAAASGDVFVTALLLLILVVFTVGGLLVWLATRHLRTLRLARMQLDDGLVSPYREAPSFSPALFLLRLHPFAVAQLHPHDVAFRSKTNPRRPR